MISKPILCVLIGISASGKSTIAKELAIKYNAKIHSSDDLRKTLFGDVSDQTHNEEVFREFNKRIKQDLIDGNNVIADATSINIKSRRSILDYIKNIDCYKIAYLTNKSVEQCIEDNIYKENPVPHHVIQRQESNYQMVFLEEGFDEILIHNENEYDVNSIQYKMKGFDQRNYHHKYDLLTHCNKCYEELTKHTNNNNLLTAAKIHDYSKLHTQTIDEDGVCHYFQHHYIGAYKLLCELDLPKDDLVEVLFYVSYHMLPFFWQNEKTHLKYKRIFGEEKYNNLLLFNNCDKIASGSHD